MGLMGARRTVKGTDVKVRFEAEVPPGWTVEARGMFVKQGEFVFARDTDIFLFDKQNLELSAFHGSQPEQRLTWKAKVGVGQQFFQHGFVKLTLIGEPR